MTNQAADKRSPIIAVALILTAVFLGVFGWLLISTPMPSECPSGLWLLDRLACLAPNELGDTFAGAFAPVAFVWLVTTVMLQRNELRLQREELRLTRTEYSLTRQEVEGQRAAMEAQVVEAQKNAAFIGKQTEILDANLKREMEAYADKGADQLCESIFAFLNQKVSKGVRHVSEYNTHQCFKSFEPADLYIDLRTVSDHFELFIIKIHRDKIKFAIDDTVSDALNMINTLNLALEGCSEAKRMIISSANIDSTERALKFLFKEKWHEEFQPD